jgi:hypothetical protein
MEHFDPKVNQAFSHVILMEQAIGSGPTPQAYLCCAQQQNQTRIVFVHVSSRYHGALDGHVTPWDGVVFAYLGEIIQGYLTTVILPDVAV